MDTIDAAKELANIIQNYAIQQPSAQRTQLEALIKADEITLPELTGERLMRELASHADTSLHALGVAQIGLKHAIPLPECTKNEALTRSVALRTHLHGLLQAMAQSPCRTGRRGKLNPQRLHGLIFNNPRVFLKRGQQQGRSTAVHLVLDASGSMTGPRMELAARACYAMAVALERCKGVNVGVTLFPADPTQEGNHHTVAPLIGHGQRIHDRFTIRTGGTTPLAEALWWVMQSMLPLKEHRKIICILSDGRPDSLPAAQCALKHAAQTGFELMGLGIQSSNLTHLLPGTSQTIHALNELAPALFGMLQKALLNQPHNDRR